MGAQTGTFKSGTVNIYFFETMFTCMDVVIEVFGGEKVRLKKAMISLSLYIVIEPCNMCE